MKCIQILMLVTQQELAEVGVSYLPGTLLNMLDSKTVPGGTGTIIMKKVPGVCTELM